MAPQNGRHRLDARFEGAVRAIGLQLVVLDEIDARRAQLVDQLRGLGGVEADAGLDDGADQRALVDAGKAAGAFNAEGGTGIGTGEGIRQLDVEKPQAAELAQLEEIAGDGGDEVGERGPQVLERPRQLDARPRVGAVGQRGRRPAGWGSTPAPAPRWSRCGRRRGPAARAFRREWRRRCRSTARRPSPRRPPATSRPVSIR
jgi:hypothetical protein